MQRLVSAALSLSLLTACAAAKESHANLGDSTWRFVAIDGAAPVSDKAQLKFEDGRIGATVGCNGMGGPWRVEDGRLIAGPLAQTEMYCEGPVWTQEKAIGALLAGAPEVTVESDRLVLRSSGHSAELERAD
jgi:heat shock protein HslJ